MSTAPLPKEIVDRIQKEATQSEKNFIQGCRDLGFDPIDAAISQRGHGYFDGARSEYLRAQPLIEALKQIENNYGDHDFVRTLIANTLEQYNSQP